MVSTDDERRVRGIIAAAAALHETVGRGLTTIALTGRDGGVIGRAADVHVNVPDESTARIQEVHRTLIHAICELIEG
jgi:phosphoheptose isomerase